MDTIDINLKKKKRRKLFTNIAIASALSFAVVGVGVVTIYNNDYQVTKAVEYDDDEQFITLDVDELNDYHFSNLFDLFSDTSLFDLSSVECTYNENTFSYDDYLYFVYQDYGILFPCLNYGEDGYFILQYNALNTPFSYSLFIDFSSISSEHYNLIKDAIELDIQANQPYNNNTFLQDIIELLVGGISATANGIGVGLSTLVGSVAIQNNAMSSFMSIVLIFGGIALAFALSRLVVNLISSLGQRNR